MPLSDHERLMQRLKELGIQPPAGQNAPNVEPAAEPEPSDSVTCVRIPKQIDGVTCVRISKQINVAEPQPENWRSTAMQGNQIAKKPEPRDAVLSVRIPKQLKNGAVSAAKRKGKRTGGSRKLSDFVIGALESAIEAEKG